MSKISIPKPVLPGFKIISELTDVQISSITEYLSEISIGIKLDEIAIHFTKFMNEESAYLLVQTILSFSELLESKETDTNSIATNLANSYKEISGIEITNETVEILKTNLLEILNSYKNLRIISKSKNLSYDNENIFNNCKIITDIRLVFNDQIEDKNRAAIILQKLHIEYQKNGESKEVYLTLDTNDLQKFKIQIEEAIEKEQIIKDDYKEIINFI